MLVVCRFLHCLQSFGRTGEVLLRYHPLLKRLGFAPVVLKRGFYRSKRTRQPPAAGVGVKVFDEECFSEVLRDLGFAVLNQILVAFIQQEIDWTTKSKEDMRASRWMHWRAMDAPRWQWKLAEPPKLDTAKAKLPTRRILWVEGVPFPTYGAKVNGVVIWDHSPPDEEHPEGRDEYQYIVTSRLDWKGAQIHSHWRMRWCIESAFGAMTERWGLGRWQTRHPNVYRATVQFMALTYGLLVIYLMRQGRPASLQKTADRFQAQAARMVLVRVGDACALLTSEVQNDWVATGVITVRAGGP